ncbi:MAG: hypothetical protein Q4C95_10895 [Planctomycetia bacterium]|nr:hypothetical protein [Planctomycetia bacterium]
MRQAFLSETEVPQRGSTSLIRLFCMVRQSNKKENAFPIVSGNDVQNVNVFPNIISLRTDVLVGSESEPLTKLSNEPRLFQMKMEKWRQAHLERRNGSEWIQLNDQPTRFMAIPGLYRFSNK